MTEVSLPMRFGTYNVLIPRPDKENKGLQSWLSRRKGVVSTIDERFDFVGLQECSFDQRHRQGEYITEELSARGWDSYLAEDSGRFTDEFHERVPIFWRRGLFTPEQAGQVLLSSWSEKELEKVPTLENRYGTYVKGHLSSGLPFAFLNVHLQHTRAEANSHELHITAMKRQESYRKMLMVMHNLHGEKAEFMVVGDFNSPQEPTHFRDYGLLSVHEVARGVEHWESNSFHNWEYPSLSQHLDKMYVTSGLRGGLARIELSDASDHYPVSYAITLDTMLIR